MSFLLASFAQPGWRVSVRCSDGRVVVQVGVLVQQEVGAVQLCCWEVRWQLSNLYWSHGE